ncbi:hypothetical protein MPTK1_3g19360 [Marchantia polymorpha subsp. ruderalis]|uniref:YDG domain-containing protein n=2 Tax=Marchantia polymorpha TaxID=3197 RepID=A0AAF6B2J0_MARPO|nr:hypothetical protein MARPO_0049s0098 [Marchantia polymorpha]BBN06224.1 hypothetical protein Mp_3g19360 [Marchantia polymorpha subsp. ruderalis]|eukprot:PTQ38819.1 hypothetical protein MARPO_0049s0098 [Marchantia polymorpha]
MPSEMDQNSRNQRSGEVFVTAGENNRLIFKTSPSHVSQGCRYRRLKDGTKVHLHLCWHFWNSEGVSKEKDLMKALDKVVEILKDLDAQHVHKPSEENFELRRGGREPEPEADGHDREHGSGLRSERTKNLGREISKTKHSSHDVNIKPTRLLDALFENGDMEADADEEAHASKQEHVGTTPIPPKRKNLFQDMHSSNLPVTEKKSGQRVRNFERRKSSKPRLEECGDVENGPNIRDTQCERHRQKKLVREREVKKEYSKHIRGPSRKIASESAMTDGKEKTHETPKRNAPSADKMKKPLHEADVDKHKEHIGRTDFDSPRERERLQSCQNLQTQQHCSVNHDDDMDEGNDSEIDTDSPVHDLMGRISGRRETRKNSKRHQSAYENCTPASDTKRSRTNTPHSKNAERGGSSREGMSVNSFETNKFISPTFDETPSIKPQVGLVGKGKKKVTFQCDTPPAMNQVKKGDLSFPEVDKVFKSPGYTSMDDRGKVMTILEQFGYLENCFRSAKEIGDVRLSELTCARRLRADLKAGEYLKRRGFCFYDGSSVVGTIPGVCVGQTFSCREELVILSIHRVQQAGIDYIPASKSHFRDAAGNKLAVAVSVVSSGGYKDDEDNDAATLTYSGQGGCSNRTHNSRPSKVQDQNQELVRGNLAMVNSYELHIPIRVVRSFVRDKTQKKIYYYDGLYDVTKYYEETGSSGFKVWKFQMVKQLGQPEVPHAFSSDQVIHYFLSKFFSLFYT